MEALLLPMAAPLRLPVSPGEEQGYLKWREKGPLQRLEMRTLTLLPESRGAPRQGAASNPRAMILQVLRQLIGQRLQRPDADLLPALEIIIAFNPHPIRERWARGILRLRAGDRAGWDTDWHWVRTVAPVFMTPERIQ